MIQKDVLISEVEVKHIPKYEIWQIERIRNLNKPVCVN